MELLWCGIEWVEKASHVTVWSLDYKLKNLYSGTWTWTPVKRRAVNLPVSNYTKTNSCFMQCKFSLQWKTLTLWTYNTSCQNLSLIYKKKTIMGSSWIHSKENVFKISNLSKPMLLSIWQPEYLPNWDLGFSVGLREWRKLEGLRSLCESSWIRLPSPTV